MYLRNWKIGLVISCFALSGCLFPPLAAAAAEPVPLAVNTTDADFSYNDNTQEQRSSEEQAAVDLEQAIKIAKANFTIPKELNQFSSSFSQSEQESFWQLRWYVQSEQQYGEMSVAVNAGTGEIHSMWVWLPQNTSGAEQVLPRYTRAQAEGIAAAFAKKMQPERFGETKLQPDSGSGYIQPLMEQWRVQTEYYYTFARYIDGAIFSEDSISVTVNGYTGAVTGYSFNWRDVKDLAPVNSRIPLEKAEQIMRTEAAPELEYLYTDSFNGPVMPAKLVYKLPVNTMRPGVVIDAVNGKVLKEDNVRYDSYLGGARLIGAVKESSNFMADISLSPVEESQVERYQALISKDEALSISRASMVIPADYSLSSSNLMQDYAFKEKMIWNLLWVPDEVASGIEGGVHISIDAVNGDIISYYIYNYNEDMRNPSVQVSADEARHIGEEYLKKHQPDKLAQTEFVSVDPLLITPVGEQEEKAYAYTVNYARVVGGVKFPQNGFFLNINSTTGQIREYQMNWWDISFAEVSSVISQNQAADIYLEKAPLEVGYISLMTSYKPSQTPEISLVYYMPNLYFSMLDALTGETLDYNGAAVTVPGQKNSFSDMAGHPNREAVELLAAYNIVESSDGKFRPDEPATNLDLIVMLVKIMGGLPDPTSGDPGHELYYESARGYGILQPGEDPAPEQSVTREELACFMVRSAGLQKAAKFSNIYNLNYADAVEISPDWRGHVALSDALGFVTPTPDGVFAPREPVSRGEAAETVVRFLRSGR